MVRVYTVIPNWNGKDSLADTIESLLDQDTGIIVVDNGSSDGSSDFVSSEYPDIELIRNPKNLGFAGGVNCGMRKALELGAEFIALLNNDAVADKRWISKLIMRMESDNRLGIVTSKIMGRDGTLDSTGECYTSWGLSFPRGRGEKNIRKYDSANYIFGASGGASLYRASTLKDIGLFDEKFFAYYEDLDISFRAQLRGWKVGYEPEAVAYHEIGATSSKIKGFTTYHTIKNLPMVFWKDVPLALMPKIFPRLLLAHWMFIFRATSRGQIWPAFKGVAAAIAYFPIILVQRYKIQSSRKMPASYINSIISHDLPPNAHRLRALRVFWWRITFRGKHA